MVLNNAQEIYVGDIPVQKIYIGDVLVWSIDDILSKESKWAY